jgi:hypothetical protein
MKRAFATIVVLAVAVSLAGCGILMPSAKMRATKETPGFKAGFNDGCAAATTTSANYRAEDFRDQESYKTDPNYRAGWANGLHNCHISGRSDDPTGRASPVRDASPGTQHY